MHGGSAMHQRRAWQTDCMWSAVQGRIVLGAASEYMIWQAPLGPWLSTPSGPLGPQRPTLVPVFTISYFRRVFNPRPARHSEGQGVFPRMKGVLEASHSGFRVQGSGFRVQSSGFRVQGSGFRVQPIQGTGYM